MLKLDLILQIMNKNAIPLIDHYQKEDSEEEPEKEPTKAITKRKKSPFELHEKFINEIKNDEKDINKQRFKEYLFIIFHYFYQKNYIIAIKM